MLAADALERTKEAGHYDVNPLPAIQTTMTGKPVVPLEYEEKLASATVLVQVTLSSDTFPKGYQFYVDIESLLVLRPPKSIVALSPAKSPSKKRFNVPDFIRENRAKFT
jgi:hypothetical protein